MDKNQILDKLKIMKPELQSKYGFQEIMLFGSYAKDKARQDSDIDIAVTLEDEHQSLENLINAKEELKVSLGKTVDLVYYDPECLNPIIKMQIDKEAVNVE
ncbi:MAG: nucleotidyltransferase domain-containing protein [Candidatus Caenarcaniphilales bacterium]|nr:nucleotidyltransferase domain-containing protein [Candidatus Caenarcaniphilales bacterium]